MHTILNAFMKLYWIKYEYMYLVYTEFILVQLCRKL